MKDKIMFVSAYIMYLLALVCMLLAVLQVYGADEVKPFKWSNETEQSEELENVENG